MPTRNEARKALNKARLPQRDKYVYRALLDLADNNTLDIPDRFQPYRQSDIYLFGTSRRNVQRALADLRLHGWISWKPKQKLKQRGQKPNHYTLSIGWHCDCKKRQETSVIERQDDALKPVIERQVGASMSASEVGIPAGQGSVIAEGVRDRGEGDRGGREELRDSVQEWADRQRQRFAGIAWNDEGD